MPLHIVRDDIANMRVDAVVIPANEYLYIDGGAGESVARVAGLESLQKACGEIGYCPVGKAVVTPAFDFPAHMIVHAVGPVWMGGHAGEREVLYGCVTESLEAARRAGAKTIALPLLSTGAFGFPAGEAIDVETRAIQTFLQRNESDVWLTLYDRNAVRAGRALFDDIDEYIDDVYVGEHGDGAQWSQRYTRRDRALEGEPLASMLPRPQDTGAMPPLAAVPSAPPPALEHALEKETSKRKSLFRRRKERLKDASQEDAPAFGAPSLGALQTPQKGSGGNYDNAGDYDSFALDKAAAACVPAIESLSLEDRLQDLDESFAQTVLRLIDERNLDDVEVYKRANMSRQLFAKIRKDDSYRPTKKTACALAFALGLDYEDALTLLSRAGFTLSHSSKFDVIVEYFLVNNVHDIFQINEALFAYDQPILG